MSKTFFFSGLRNKKELLFWYWECRFGLQGSEVTYKQRQRSLLLHDLMQELNKHWFSYWLACKAFQIKKLSSFCFACYSLGLCDVISLWWWGCLTWLLIVLLRSFLPDAKPKVLYIFFLSNWGVWGCLISLSNCQLSLYWVGSVLKEWGPTSSSSAVCMVVILLPPD